MKNLLKAPSLLTNSNFTHLFLHHLQHSQLEACQYRQYITLSNIQIKRLPLGTFITTQPFTIHIMVIYGLIILFMEVLMVTCLLDCIHSCFLAWVHMEWILLLLWIQLLLEWIHFLIQCRRCFLCRIRWRISLFNHHLKLRFHSFKPNKKRYPRNKNNLHNNFLINKVRDNNLMISYLLINNLWYNLHNLKNNYSWGNQIKVQPNNNFYNNLKRTRH